MRPSLRSVVGAWWLAMALFVGLAPAPSTRGLDALSDAPPEIPGIAWSGGTVASSVGGAVVDRVWRLDLASGRVAVINLAGSAGSELGLYLFDGFARSIFTDDPIAQSAKPGGNQGLTAILPPGTYYLNVNGRNVDRSYDFKLSLVLLADTTPPSLALRPVPGGEAVNRGSAMVQVLASDLLSGVATMRFRVDGGEWGAWQAALITAEVTIPTVRGAHRIDAQVTNGLGLTSSIASTSVVFDDIPPTAARVTPRADGSTTSSRPTITYQFSEPMRAKSWIAGGLVVLTRNGGVVPGTFNYDAAERTGRWSALEPLQLGEPYVVQLGSVVDLAGNAPTDTPAWVLQYQTATRIIVDTAPIKTTYRTLRTIIGELRGIPVGSTISLDYRQPGGVWVEQSTFVSTSLPLRAKFNPSQSGEWRLRYEGDAGHRAATSAALAVKVTPKLTLSGAGGYVRARISGATVQIRGTAMPASNPLTLVRYRCNSLFTGCVVAARISVTADESGAVTYAWKATRGYFIWKLKSAAGSGLEAATTGRLRFAVR